MKSKTRKLIWSVPLVATLAIVGALAVFVALAPNEAAAQVEEAPGMPTDLTGEALGPTSIELMWDAPAAGTGGTPDGYRIDYSDDGMVWYPLDPQHDSTVYTDDTDLSAVQTRHYRVFAFNSGGSGPALYGTAVVTDKSDKAGPPTNLIAEDGPTEQTQIKLTWDAPEDPDGAPVAKYLLEISKDGRNFPKPLELTAKAAKCPGSDRACEYTHKGLLESQPRSYRVTAVNYPNGKQATAVSSDTSKTVSHTTDEPAVLPEMPVVRVGLNPAGRMTLYWDTPGNAKIVRDMGAPIDGYYIYGGEGAVAEGAVADEHEVSKLHFVEANTDLVLTDDRILGKFDKPDLDGLDNQLYYVFDATDSGSITDGSTDNKKWHFQVMAVNSDVRRNLDDGKWNTDDGNWSTDLMVDNRKDLEGSAFRAYVGNNGTVVCTNPPDLDDNRVSGATDSDLCSPIDANADVADDLLKRPILTASRINNVNAGRTDIKLDWKVEKLIDTNTGDTPDAEGVQNDVKQYRIERSEDRVDWKAVTPAGDAPVGVTMTMTDMMRVAGTTYYYRVLAEHNKRMISLSSDTADIVGNDVTVWTEASNPVSITTAPAGKPNPPMLDTVSPASETQIDLTWTPPGDKGSKEVGYGMVVEYEIEVSDDGKSWSLLTKVAGKLDEEYTYDDMTKKLTVKKVTADSDVEFFHKGLLQGQTKYYRVTTINNGRPSDRQSVPTDVDNATTYGSQVPVNPGGLVAKAKDRSSIELVWNARASDIAAAPIIGYKIESSPLNDKDECAKDWSVLMANTMSTTTSYTHMGLMPETGYCYRVFGINAVATSTSFVGFGDSYVVTNDNDAVAMTDAAVVPGMPMNVMAAATSDTEIKVTWAAPASDGHSAITGYMVQSKYMMADGTMSAWMDVDPAHTGTAMMYMDTGLTAETTYYYQVAATNDIGTGEYSDGTATATTKKPNQPPTAGAAIDAQTVTVDGDPATVDVSDAFSDADADVLTYGATSDDTMIATVAVSGSMVTITGVAVGKATIMVTATDPAGAMAKQTFMVTVEAAPMLTAPSITSVMSNSAGMATIMLMPGENADQHWVYAYRTDYKEDYIRSPKAAGDATSVTMSGLTSGMSYWFIAIAGRGEKGHEEWSVWSGWSAATPIK